MNLRTIVVIACLYVSFFGLPNIELPNVQPPAPEKPAVREPTAELRDAVQDVADICESMDAFDRLVWMSTWEDCSTIVAGEDEDVSVVFENTLGLRLFTDSTFDVAWKRLADASGKYRGLGDAVEKAFATVIGNDVRPWSDDLADDAIELYDALAWAGARSE
tara:strand:- start:8 stop:493 length:486 start_codon:yes stop_codon:yes gene_type:complete